MKIVVLARPSEMPWLYYVRVSASSVLTDDGIPTLFGFPDDVMKFRVHVYAVNGTYLGFYNVTSGRLQLCKNTQSYLNAAYTFGVTYLQKVSVISYFIGEFTATVAFDFFTSFTYNEV